MKIREWPSIRLGFFLQKGGRSKNGLWDWGSAYFFRNGRSALFHGIKGIPKRGRRKILVPAYNCGMEVEAVLKCNFEPVFYPVDERCQSDVDAVKRLLTEDVAAIIVTHFNGFPQAVNEIVDIGALYECQVIEDCAHVLSTEVEGAPAGSKSGMAVFSPRKFLPIPDGGVLVLNREHEFTNSSVEIPGWGDVVGDTVRLLGRRIKEGLEGMGLAYGWKKGEKEDGDLFRVHDFREISYDYGMSPVSHNLLERFDIEEISARRRRNYRCLERGLVGIRGLRSLMGELPPKTCPWHFLAVVNEPVELHRHLWRHNIRCLIFWAYFHERYPMGRMREAEYLKKHVVALPIHQDLGEEHMEYIKESVRGYFGGKG